MAPFRSANRRLRCKLMGIADNLACHCNYYRGHAELDHFRWVLLAQVEPSWVTKVHVENEGPSLIRSGAPTDAQLSTRRSCARPLQRVVSQRSSACQPSNHHVNPRAFLIASSNA